VKIGQTAPGQRRQAEKGQNRYGHEKTRFSQGKPGETVEDSGLKAHGFNLGMKGCVALTIPFCGW
jgi:hypothetical protein